MSNQNIKNSFAEENYNTTYRIKQITNIDKDEEYENIKRNMKIKSKEILNYFCSSLNNDNDYIVVFSHSNFINIIPTFIKHAVKLKNENISCCKLSLVLINNLHLTSDEELNIIGCILKLEDIKVETTNTVFKEVFKSSKIDLKNMFSPEM